MPSLTTSVTAAPKLSPTLNRQLQTKLNEYKSLKAKLDPIKLRMKTLADELGGIRDEVTNELSLDVEGLAKITLVGGIYKKFNPKTFVANGGDLKIYQMSIDEKPRKAYNKITLAGERDEDGDDA